MHQPLLCPSCGESIDRHQTNRRFCGNSCRAKFFGTGRVMGQACRDKIRTTMTGKSLTQATKDKIRVALLARGAATQQKQKSDEIVDEARASDLSGRTPRLPRTQPGERWKSPLHPSFSWQARYHPYPFTRVCPCRTCGRYVKGIYHRFCGRCEISVANYRARAAFRFNVYDYPQVFDLGLIKVHGWYSPLGRSGRNPRLNLSGVSRDHMFSIMDGYKSGVSPTILGHPANCRIMLHSENSSKKSKSVLTIKDLLRRIAKWDLTHGSMVGGAGFEPARP